MQTNSPDDVYPHHLSLSPEMHQWTLIQIISEQQNPEVPLTLSDNRHINSDNRHINSDDRHINSDNRHTNSDKYTSSDQ